MFLTVFLIGFFGVILLLLFSKIRIKILNKKENSVGFFIIREDRCIIDLHVDLDEIKKKKYVVLMTVVEKED